MKDFDQFFKDLIWEKTILSKEESRNKKLMDLGI